MASTANSEVNFQGAIDLKAYHTRLDEWAMEIIETIDKELGQRVLSPEGTELEDTRMTRQIFTLGELAQICPHRINKRLFLLMQGIVFQQGSTKKKRKDLPSTQTQVKIICMKNLFKNLFFDTHTVEIRKTLNSQILMNRIFNLIFRFSVK